MGRSHLRKRDDGWQSLASVHRSGLTWQRPVALRAPNVRSRSSVAMLVGITTLVASLAVKVEAQEFQTKEASSVAGLAVDQLKPKTVTFIDRPSDALIDPDTGLIRFEDWMQASPNSKASAQSLPELSRAERRYQ